MADTRTVWFVVRTTGQFRQGHSYTKDQLGVLGRMAAQRGFLVPIEQAAPAKAPQSPVEPRKRAGRGGTKGAVADAEQGRAE